MSVVFEESRAVAGPGAGPATRVIALASRSRGSTVHVGVDLGTTGVRIAAVERRPGGWQPLLLAAEDVPPQAEGRWSEAAAAALRRLWEEARLGERRAVTVLGSEHAFVRTIEVPPMSEAERRRALRLQAERVIPIPPAEAVVDWTVLDREGPGPQRALFVGARRETVRSLVDALRGAGLDPVAVEVDLLCAYRALVATGQADPRRPEPVAVLDIGARQSRLGIFVAGAPEFVRTLPAGAGDGLRRELQADVVRSLEFFFIKSGDGSRQGLFLVGGGAELPGLAEALDEALCEQLSAVVPVEPPFGVRVFRYGPVGPRWAVALGAALWEVLDR